MILLVCANLLCCPAITLVAAPQTAPTTGESSAAGTARPSIQPPEGWHARYDLFQMTIEQAGLKVVDLDEALDAPEKTLIVALGARSMATLSRVLGSFGREGGAILLGADSSAATPQASTISATATTQRQYAVQGHLDCIRLTLENPTDSPLLQGVKTVVVNNASYISETKAQYRPWTNHIVWGKEVSSGLFRGKALLSSSAGPSRTRPPADQIRVIACADPSIFTNGMIWHGDNAILVINIANALVPGRTQLYFMADGSAQTSYQGPLQEAGALAAADQTPELEIEQMLRLANTVVANAQDSDLINEIVADRPRRIPTPYYHRGLLFFLAFIILCIALYLLFSRIARRAPHAHLPAPKAQSSAAALGAFDPSPEHRRGEAAQALAAAALTKICGSDDPQKWLEIGTDKDQRSGRMSVGQLSELQRLIDYATAVSPRPIPLSELRELDRLAAQLSSQT